MDVAKTGQHVENAEATVQHDEGALGWVGINAGARAATEDEHKMTVGQALRQYRKAVFWSIVVSLVVVMDGYDTALIGSLFGFPAFQRKFGRLVPGTEDKYQLEAKWQTALGLASPLGNIVGIFLNGVFTERFGHRKTLLGFLTFLTGCIFICFFATSIEMLFAGEILCGLSWGVFTTMAPAYASEVTPVLLRGYLEIWITACWGYGQLVAYGVLDSLDGNLTDWAWRIPFAVQWVWPAIIFPLVLFCPESPWWLVRQGRLEEAERSVERLTSGDTEGTARNAVALMIETTNIEKRITAGAGYLDCFKGSNGWRTEISCMAWLTQAAAGFAIAQYAAYFFEQAGLPSNQAYKLTLGQGGLALVFDAIALVVTTKVGRRPIYLAGCVAMSINWFVVGFLAIKPHDISIGYASAALYMFWLCLYHVSIGPVAFIIVGETSSTRLRSKTIALARNAYNVWNIMSATVAPYILNPTEGNWKGKSAFLPACLLIACFVWGLFRLPEAKDRTYEELDLLFDKGIGARKFASYQINIEAEIVEHGAYCDKRVAAEEFSP